MASRIFFLGKVCTACVTNLFKAIFSSTDWVFQQPKIPLLSPLKDFLTQTVLLNVTWKVSHLLHLKFSNDSKAVKVLQLRCPRLLLPLLMGELFSVIIAFPRQRGKYSARVSSLVGEASRNQLWKESQAQGDVTFPENEWVAYPCPVCR